MDRRHFLATVGATAAVGTAGCGSSDSDEMPFRVGDATFERRQGGGYESVSVRGVNLGMAKPGRFPGRRQSHEKSTSAGSGPSARLQAPSGPTRFIPQRSIARWPRITTMQTSHCCYSREPGSPQLSYWKQVTRPRSPRQ
ncbi:twin-arginine translocation signal domain-containing protein [Halovenus salina]|uniref:Twin-arginine translocation signal domain-containing protein n=1 Tax=Halovenus salina TaxID=1510225 RepID=A0ABD5VXB9_9EURY